MYDGMKIYRAVVTSSSSTTGDIRVRIPALFGPNSDVALSKTTRPKIGSTWTVPAPGTQVLAAVEDATSSVIHYMVSTPGAEDQFYQDTAPTSPQVGNIWVRSTDGREAVWSGAEWVAILGEGTGTPGTVVEAYRSTSVNYQVVDGDYTINCTAAITVTLPSATIAGRLLNIKNSSLGVVTVEGVSGQLIDGATSQEVPSLSNMHTQSTGTGWVLL